MSPLDPSPVIPFRAEARRRVSWREGLAVGPFEAAVSLVLNLAVLTFLVQVAFPRHLDTSEPRTITVDLVPEPPKSDTASDGKSRASPPAGAKTTSPAGDGSKAANPTGNAPSAASAKTAADAKQSEPPPSAPTAATPSNPAEHAAPEAAAAAAAPAPIEGSGNAAPRLVAAPIAPASAARQAVTNPAPPVEAKPPDPPRAAERSPPPAPEAPVSPDDPGGTVPEATRRPETPQPPPEPSADEKSQAENTAKLAAALPMAPNLPPTFARAEALPGLGDTADRRFRGEVYSQFHKADDLIEQARAAHLKGQTVVQFSIDDKGALVDVAVAVSSGNPEVDRIAEDIIRQSAPFPPPPPGAQRVFSPAIRLGLDD